MVYSGLAVVPVFLLLQRSYSNSLRVHRKAHSKYYNCLGRTARARGYVSGVGVTTDRYAERNRIEWRIAASTCLERLRITAEQFDLFENAMVWVQYHSNNTASSCLNQCN